MHLGAELSLLTSLKKDPQTGKPEVDPQSASRVLQNLVFCLADLIRYKVDKASKPTLILIGDILELALANDNVAAMVFERFVEKAMEPGSELFGNILYIPGNHDHHLWESARETQYVRNYLPKTHPNTFLEIPWHTTKIFMQMEKKRNQVPSCFLKALLQRYAHLKDFTINNAYPNLGLIKDKRCIVFHHGHFVESIYLLMTTLKNLIFPAQQALTRTVDDLEAENFAWIDFFWSTLGRSGDVGKDVEIIYDKMLDEKQFRKLVENLAIGLAAKYGKSGWLDSEIIKGIIDGLVSTLYNLERRRIDRPLSPDAEQGLQDYVNGPLQIQIVHECTNRHLYFPREVTFVFGHTHKPFEKVYDFGAYLGDGVPVYNTGGWVVETLDPAALHGGAVVLLNENLDVVSLRMYNEADGPVDRRVNVKVHEQPLPGNKNSSFFNEVNDRVQANHVLWDKFSKEVPHELQLRRKILQDKINS
jgi:hypothetical protein